MNMFVGCVQIFILFLIPVNVHFINILEEVSRCEGPAGKPHGSPLPHTDVFKHNPFS